MHISESNLKHYLNCVLQLIEFDNRVDYKQMHRNICLLESIMNELSFYSEVVKSLSLKLLIEDVRCLVEYCLINRYTILGDKSIRKSISKRVKYIKSSITSFYLDDFNIDINHIRVCINVVLKEIYKGTDIRNYDMIISKYTELSNNLKALSNIVDNIDAIDEEIHFLNTFLDNKFLYLGVQKDRLNLKRIAESLLKDIF